MMKLKKVLEKSELPPPLVPVEILFRSFSLDEILSATNNFDTIIGRGGSGEVYKGIINDGTTVVAIKRIKSTSKQGESQFRTEIEMLLKFRHSNIVSLIGYCYSSGEKILVYEYMNNGSLADQFNKVVKGCTLSWVQRLKICLGAARGLDYLHTGIGNIIEDGVIHRDVKSSNILLDDRWVAKVSDFGLSKVRLVDQSYIRTRVKGTNWYLDPEYFFTGKLRMKSDVYSFGVVLFEVLRGSRAAYLEISNDRWEFSQWVSRRMREDRVHENVDPNMRWEILPDSLTKFVQIVQQCLLNDWKRRPTMTQVVATLETVLALQLGNRGSFSCEEIDTFGNLENVDSTKEKRQESVIVKSKSVDEYVDDKIMQSRVKPTGTNAFEKMMQKPTETNAFVKMLQSFIICGQEIAKHFMGLLSNNL